MTETYAEAMCRYGAIRARENVKRDRSPYPPVLDQLRAHFAKQSPATVMQPWGLDELRSQVTGRFGRPPQRGEIAVALKLLGFKPVRIWRDGWNGRHAWILASNTPILD